jgi:hypothetical protein
MLETIDQETIDPVDNDDTPPMMHLVCHCDPNVALCGVRNFTTSTLYDHTEEADCVVCEAMFLVPCPRCGLEG